jgi:thiol:disulfide interchange protein
MSSRAVLAAVTALLLAGSDGAARAPQPWIRDATQAVANAMAEARKTGKHVLLNFGADWCRECRILEKTFAEPDVARFLHANFVTVSVPVGDMVGLNYAGANVELVRRYGVFTTKENAGIPSIVILDSAGNVIARTDAGEWRREPAVQPENVLRDLKRWAPKGGGG